MAYLRATVPILALLALAACNPLGLTAYENSRFAYGIRYPEQQLVAGPVTADGTGRTFVSRDGLARARVWSRPSTGEGDSAVADAIERDCAGGAADYRRVDEGKLTIECAVGDEQVYHMALVRRDRVVAFRMTYPADRNGERWRVTAVNMARTFYARAEAPAT